MNNYFPLAISADHVPGEQFLVKWLQEQVVFRIGSKVVKQGRLLLFRRVHYYIQIAILNSKNVRENFEVPIPFKVEYHDQDKLLYFDYRVQSLNLQDPLILSKKVSSSYFDKILEISRS